MHRGASERASGRWRSRLCQSESGRERFALLCTYFFRSRFQLLFLASLPLPVRQRKSKKVKRKKRKLLNIFRCQTEILIYPFARRARSEMRILPSCVPSEEQRRENVPSVERVGMTKLLLIESKLFRSGICSESRSFTPKQNLAELPEEASMRFR